MPFTLKFEKRLNVSRKALFLVPVVSLLLALLVGSFILSLAGASPIETYRAMFSGAFGSTYNISETLVKATPLILTGLSVAIAFRMLFWNIGAEGQLVMGGIATAAVALFLVERATFLPQSLWFWLPIMMLAAIIAGAIWGLIPALLKAFLNVNEIITTLMFNYIAILLYQYLFTSAWKDPAGFGFPGSAEIAQFLHLPRLSGRLHLGFIIAVLAAALIWVLMDKTRLGYEIRLIGENRNAARYAGVNIIRNIIIVMILSGGLAGLAGLSEITGISFRLQHGLAVGYGFTGIIVAWLARLNPWGVLVVGTLLAALLVGGDQIQISMGLPASVALVLQGLILLFVLGGDVFTRYRLRVIRHAAAPASAATQPEEG